jgi:Cysteine-rich secretory protein family
MVSHCDLASPGGSMNAKSVVQRGTATGWLSLGLALGVAGGGGCVADRDDGGAGAGEREGVARAGGALGQPSGDFPSYDERVMLYATNRARMSPAAETWPAYVATPPLQWSISLNQSARAHSLNMRDTPCFTHATCGVTPDDTFPRIESFYTGLWTSLGENIAGGPTEGIGVVHNWIFEIGAAPTETGHRDNIFSRGFNLIGNGFAPGGPARPALNNLWTQDFAGTGTNLVLPRMSDGIHFPATVAAGASVTFGTTYYDAAATGPAQVLVVVDGLCHPMALAMLNGLPRGTATKGAYEVALPLAAGCHPYYFEANPAAASTYPDTGVLQVGVAVAAGSCALFAATRVPITCGPNGLGGASGSGGATGAGGAIGGGVGGSPGTGGRGGTTGAGGALGQAGGPGTGGGGSGGARATGGASGTADAGTTTGSGGGPGAGSAGSGAGGSPGAVDDPTPLNGGCACQIPAGTGGAGNSLALLLATLGLVIARRRRLPRRDNTLI